jgi:membrane protease YdiL (CAAX protease family)
LWFRGWTFPKIGLQPTFKDTGIGLLLLAVTTIVWVVIFYAAYFISPQTVAHMLATYAQLKAGTLSIHSLVGFSVINAAFEEIFVSGYVITALKPSRGTTFAINVSAAIRLLYHIYQGQMAVLGVLPLGLIYAFWYARTGRLWPLIVAHTIQDVASLLY